MTKAELLKICEEQGIGVTGKETNKELNNLIVANSETITADEAIEHEKAIEEAKEELEDVKQEVEETKVYLKSYNCFAELTDGKKKTEIKYLDTESKNEGEARAKLLGKCKEKRLTILSAQATRIW